MKCAALLLGFCLVVGTLTAAEVKLADTPRVPKKIRQLMQDRDYEAAIAAIDAAIKAKDAPADYLTYLKGRAYYFQHDHLKAVETFDSLQKEFPKSQWTRRARFSKALALARKRDFRSAEQILRVEAEYLLSDERRQEIAAVYLEFADNYFKPPKEDNKPNYAKALEFYRKALEVGPEPKKRIEVELLVGQCLQKLGKYNEAIKQYTKFIKEHSDSPWDIEARYRLGQCQLKQSHYRAARQAWEDLLAKHADAKSERIAEAMYEISRTWGIPEPDDDEQLNLGTAALERFAKRFPKHELAAKAHLEIARSHMYRRRHEDAVTVLKRFLADKNYQKSDEIPTARQLLGRCWQLQKKFPEALGVWREYLVKHPAHKQWSKVQRAIIDTEYLMAKERFKADQWDAARELWTKFLAKYPLDRRNPNILYLFGRMQANQKRWDEAIADWRRVVSKYPKNEAAALAQFAIADTLERELGKLQEALDEYKKVLSGEILSGTRYQAQAREAIDRLTAREMTVSTDRVFRSDEVPKLTLITRNVESVTVRAYKIDMETYFRKMHLARGVEALDIALINPDKTFEFKVPKYAKYQELESQIEVPLPKDLKSGVMAVTVSTKSAEATTMVIQSDLDVVVKGSRDEVFVFAENMRTGKPWPGVRLLISDGKEVFAEAATGDDGVLQQSYEQLRHGKDVRVFAIAGGNIASNIVGLQGVGISQGLTDKGYIYTDRPVYRPGQDVHIRGCLRHVPGPAVGDQKRAFDTYTNEQGKKYTLRISDSRNRLVHQEEVALSKFGTFHARFLLPVTSPQGKYRVMLKDIADKTFQGQFQVVQYKLEPIRLEIDAPRKVLYRGEEIEGVIRATYYYGAPLAAREIRYRLAKGRTYTAKTNEKGEIPFKFPTREFRESQVLPLTATLPQRNLTTSTNFVLATQGFGIELETVRPVYMAAETFEVTVRTRDAEGKPVPRDLTLKVLERTTVRGKVGERLVEEHKIKTGDDGTTRQTLKLDNGGRYLVRAEGVDRFNSPISGRHAVFVSGEKDDTRLRILADRQTYKVGDTAEIKLHWREDPALALVTFQGARVLDYRLIPLKKGANTLKIPMTARLAPNFDLAVAVMTDPRVAKKDDKRVIRFHEAVSPFRVERELCVRLDVRRKAGAKGPIRPGEPVNVTVTTTDPQGKPVSAELSLAMVGQSLLDRFPWQIPSIQEFFKEGHRRSALTTTTSATFSYHPDTMPINPRLLSEQDRREIREAEVAARRLGTVATTTGAGFGGGDIGGEDLDSDELLDAGTEEFDDEEDDYSDNPFQKEGGKDPFAGVPQTPEVTRAKESTKTTGPTAGAPLHETGYWNPAIVTDKKGLATVTITMPGRSTAWNLLAKGITTDTLAGEATDKLVTRKDLFGQLKLPLAFTDGDEAEVSASVHNHALEKGKIEVTLKTTIAGRSVEEKKTIDAKGKGIHELAFKAALKRPEPPKDKKSSEPPEIDVAFELTVAAGDRRDVVRQSIPLKPYGMPVYATVSGTATADTTAWIEVPKTMPVERPGMQILIGPTVEQSLMDIVLGEAPWCQREAAEASPGVQTATNDLMAALALQKLLAKTREAGGPQAAALDARIRSALSLLVSSESKDGGWSWTGEGKYNCLEDTARIVWALTLARKAGYPAPAGSYGAIEYLRNQIAKTANDDFNTKSILLHALAVDGQGDFALANRLYRSRSSLSPTALVHLALAFSAMGRKETAGELLDLLAKQRAKKDGDENMPKISAPGPGYSQTEFRALWAIAIQQVRPQSPEAKVQVDWLLAHRTGHRWVPERATGPAAMALCQWFAESRFEGQRYRLAVFVNDTRAAALDIDPTAGTQVIDVPTALLKKGRQRINIQLTGRGRYTYQCILGGFVPAEKLVTNTGAWPVERTYEPAQKEIEGRQIPRGFDVITGNYRTFKNPLTQLPLGQRGKVHLDITLFSSEWSKPYFVLTEPIPAGTAVVENSISGTFERYQISPGAITFYVGPRHAGDITYELYGYLPGKYRAGPTVLRNANCPDQFVVSKPKTFTVLPEGQKSSDPYKNSPDELYALGQHYFKKGKLELAGKYLTELLQWKLPDKQYRDVVLKLLDVHLEAGRAAEVLRYSEIIGERWTDVVIPFDKVVRLGKAYHEVGEYERAYIVYRTTIESSFGRESAVAAFLDQEGDFLRAVELMQRLLRSYPPEGYVASATYGLAQRVYAKAPAAPADIKLRERKINRIDLVRGAWVMLEDFLTAYPEDPAADRASFSAANALLEMKQYEKAIAACNRYAERYPNSDLLDTFWYVIGYCHFALNQHEAALKTCRKVADHKRTQGGREVESDNKWRAIYILGQVYHSLGRAADAVREYRRVADRFVDAKQSIDYFMRKGIAMPEVTTLKPGEPAVVDLKFRNIAACDAKVYKIDLMKFSLLKRNLAGITRINLAGIQPYHETSVELGEGKDYGDRHHKLPLPLKEEGAYLVVCRGENLYASGLVLVSPLVVEVQEDARSGRVRTTVKDATKGKYLRDVHVKVIGNRNADFFSGDTDLRGVFVADEVEGAATVIAQDKEGRYAFFRSKAARAAPAGRMAIRRRRTGTTSLDLGSDGGEAEVAIQKALKSATRINVEETPLSDVVEKLKDLHGIEIQIDKRALDDVGVGTDTPITRNLSGVSLRSALRLILRELDLTYVIQDEALMITTPEEAECRLATKIYPVQDLVMFVDKEGNKWADFDSLTDLITTTVQPTVWDAVGGPGSIAGFENNMTLVISQTQEVHEEIEHMLAKLRQVAAEQGQDGTPRVREQPKMGPGGLGGGMGGGGGFFGGTRQKQADTLAELDAAEPAPGAVRVDLLQGLDDTNRTFQRRQMERFKRMNQGGGFGGGGVGGGMGFF